MTLFVGFVVTWSVTREADIISHEEAFAQFEARAESMIDRFHSRIQQAIASSDDLLRIYQNSSDLDQELRPESEMTKLKANQFSYLINNFSGLSRYRKFIAFLNRESQENSSDFIFEQVWSSAGDFDQAVLLEQINTSDIFGALINNSLLNRASAAVPLPDGVLKEFSGGGYVLIVSSLAGERNKDFSIQILDAREILNDLKQVKRFADMDLQLSSILKLPNGEEVELDAAISDFDDSADYDDYFISVHSFQFGSQVWNAVAWSTEEIFETDHFRVQVALFVCVILTGLVYYIVWSQSERTRRVSAIIDRRTRALQKANDELAEHYEVLQDLNLDLSKARESAEAASHAKSEFLATMSHELRTPLNAILGFSQILKDQVIGPLGDERYVEYSNDIHASGSHLLGLINDILDLAKLEANQLQIENHEVYPSDLLDNVKSLVTPQFTEKNIALNLTLSDELPQPIVGDDLRLKQIIINLVSNSIKFTDQGHIDVKIYPKPIEVDGIKPGYVIEVSDTGIGIPEDKQSLLFQRFTQIDAALTRKHGGVGLGLAICHELIVKMGGTISVKSQTDVGTTIFVHLPLEEASSADNDDMMI
ncbi:HAMP domain-containing sensor histidine kinase [Kordiimonas sp. SCSIO 12610]|uniref:sensor histidine kinase n=1 Tax=Kordiimonas sp. SCSIO 12610 TaxID=2829597 RepID=UPI00210A8D87|nr:ATP-binding protein [Kordiimonas sp. SCSIO 12610]UTW54430.1 hypothetical protein KFF44_11495 [Kordiimonas sp. SCSIO 12610]